MTILRVYFDIRLMTRLMRPVCLSLRKMMFLLVDILFRRIFPDLLRIHVNFLRKGIVVLARVSSWLSADNLLLTRGLCTNFLKARRYTHHQSMRFDNNSIRMDSTLLDCLLDLCLSRNRAIHTVRAEALLLLCLGLESYLGLVWLFVRLGIQSFRCQLFLRNYNCCCPRNKCLFF